MNIKAQVYSKITSIKNFFVRLFKAPPVLCTVTFIFDCKGVYGAGKDKKETVFAYINKGKSNHDLIPLFNPPGLQKANCKITDIIVIPIAEI